MVYVAWDTLMIVYKAWDDNELVPAAPQHCTQILHAGMHPCNPCINKQIIEWSRTSTHLISHMNVTQYKPSHNHSYIHTHLCQRFERCILGCGSEPRLQMPLAHTVESASKSRKGIQTHGTWIYWHMVLGYTDTWHLDIQTHGTWI